MTFAKLLLFLILSICRICEISFNRNKLLEYKKVYASANEAFGRFLPMFLCAITAQTAMTTVHDHGISWVIVTDIALVRRAISLRRRKLLIGQLNESPLGLFIAGVELRVTFTQNVPKWNFNNEYQAEILHPKVSILRVEVSFTTSFAI